MHRVRRTLLGVLLLAQLLNTSAFAQTRYPAERDHSPITRQVAQRLSDIVADGLSQGKFDNRFIKVGDSITVAPSYFMGQFNSPDHTPGASGVTRDLDRYEYLRSSMEFFLTGVIPDGGTTSFERESHAAQSGQTASWAVGGDPSPLDQEIAAVAPMFAVIMFGTNDIGWWQDDHLVMSWIIQHLSEIVDECIAEGTVPILKAPPPRVGYELKMLTLSHLVRALAQARQIPFINYHRAMMPLPDYGLGGDGVHPNVYQWNWMCHLTPTGLQYGNNMHNLVAMQALDRSLRATVGGASALDFEPSALTGEGTQGSPVQVDGIPFIDAGVTSPGALDYHYAFTLAESRQLRFMVMCQDSTDIDVTLLDDSFGQLFSDDGQIDVTLAPGQYYMRVETADGTAGNAGEYQALVMDRTTTGMPDSHGIFVDGAQAAPSQIDPNQSTVVTFTVTVFDDGSISSVVLDLSELGGGSSVAMTHLGDGSYSFAAPFTVAVEGEKLVTITAQDNDANQVLIPVYVMVGTPPATLTVANVGVASGGGMVTSSPMGIDCGSDCSEDFVNGTPVTLTATANPGSNFAGWSADCSVAQATCDLSMTEDRFVTATFEPIGHTYTLSVAKDGAGDGTVSSSPSGIDCGGVCSQDFLSGTLVELSATADGDSVFAGWNGDCSGSGPCSVTMSAARSVMATFHSTTVLPLVIYDDVLASGWQDWSWSATIDLAGTSPTWNGSAHAVNATVTGAWGAFSPAMVSGSVDTAGFDSIKFHVHGGTAPDKAFSFVTENADGMSIHVPFTAVADAWTEVIITLDQLGNPDSISRLYFQNFSDGAIGMVTFDDIRMEPSVISLFGDGFESGDASLWSAAVQ